MIIDLYLSAINEHFLRSCQTIQVDFDTLDIVLLPISRLLYLYWAIKSGSKKIWWKNVIFVDIIEFKKVVRLSDMKKLLSCIFTYIKRKWWYILLLVSSTWFVCFHRVTIFSMELDKFTPTNLVFILWLILLILPLFSELEFLGIKLKKEVEKATSEVKDSISDLKIQLVQFQASNSVANHIQFGDNILPTEEKLDELLRSVHALQNNVSNNEEYVPINRKDDMDKSMYLFKIRLGIETSVSELTEKLGYGNKMPLMKMIQLLYQSEVIDRVTSDLISQVVKIANRGVHGEIVSDEYVNFVKEVYPEIQRQLKEALMNLSITVCPKCKYKGYSRYENVCPQCGYTQDEE